jgi:hypothetical protein
MTATPHDFQTVWLYRLRTALEALSGHSEREAPANWAVLEAAVRREMRPQLAPEVTLANDVEAFSFGLISSMNPNKHPPEVFLSHTNLAARTLHDLRIAVEASLRGYTMQAWTVAASAFEAAHMAGFIGEDPERGAGWQAHQQYDTPYANVYDTVHGTFSYLQVTTSREALEEVVKNEYDLYRYLCMGKHSNPIAERNRYWLHEETTSTLMFTPFYHPSRVKEARMGLGLAARSALLAAWVVSKAHATSFASLQPQLSSLATRTAAAVGNWQAHADGDEPPPAT